MEMLWKNLGFSLTLSQYSYLTLCNFGIKKDIKDHIQLIACMISFITMCCAVVTFNLFCYIRL